MGGGVGGGGGGGGEGRGGGGGGGGEGGGGRRGMGGRGLYERCLQNIFRTYYILTSEFRVAVIQLREVC